MAAEYSFGLHGEKFRLPGPDDYVKEFERLKVLVSQQQSLGREIVVVICARINKWLKEKPPWRRGEEKGRFYVEEDELIILPSTFLEAFGSYYIRPFLARHNIYQWKNQHH